MPSADDAGNETAPPRLRATHAQTPLEPMPAPFFQHRASVLLNRPLARDTYLIRLEVPDLAQAIRPGQFVMLRLPHGTDPLLGRPFALYDTVEGEGGTA